MHREDLFRREEFGHIQLLFRYGRRKRDLLPSCRAEGQPAHPLSVQETQRPGRGQPFEVHTVPDHLMQRCAGDVQTAFDPEQIEFSERLCQGESLRLRQVDCRDTAALRRCRGSVETADAVQKIQTAAKSARTLPANFM